MFLEEEVEIDAWRREDGEVQDNDDDAERSLVEVSSIQSILVKKNY